ncbi:MAG: Zn-ribbon-containing protein [Defluviitaleaceae bacterium]|nr:Zn-ribbon-containing protein [Defluviitaleaceae bacterium]
MNTFRINYTPKDKIEDEVSATDLLWNYLDCMYKNGQIQYDYLLTKHPGGYMAIVTLPEDSALDEKYNNGYNSEYSEINRMFEIHMENLGENLNEQDTCACEEKPEWYMLYTSWGVDKGPVLCGKCGHTVPLYKLPYIFEEEEHFSVLGWKRAYKAIDKLFMYGLSDRFTYRQMHNANSQLAKTGREICEAFEKAAGIPFYYTLYYYNKTPLVCPVCGGKWQMASEKAIVHYKCDKCRLVAGIK